MLDAGLTGTLEDADDAPAAPTPKAVRNPTPPLPIATRGAAAAASSSAASKVWSSEDGSWVPQASADIPMDDDDEEYVPPGKNKSDPSDPNRRPRGRPPARAVLYVYAISMCIGPGTLGNHSQMPRDSAFRPFMI